MRNHGKEPSCPKGAGPASPAFPFCLCQSGGPVPVFPPGSVSQLSLSMLTPARDRPSPRPSVLGRHTPPASSEFRQPPSVHPPPSPSVPPTENSEGGLLEGSVPAGWLALAGARRVRGRESLCPAVSSWTRRGEARAEGGRASRDPDGDVPSDTSEAWVWAPVGRAGPLWGRQSGLAGSPVGCLCTKTPPQTNLLEQSKCSENVSRMFVSFVIMGRGRGSH